MAVGGARGAIHGGAFADQLHPFREGKCRPCRHISQHIQRLHCRFPQPKCNVSSIAKEAPIRKQLPQHNNHTVLKPNAEYRVVINAGMGYV